MNAIDIQPVFTTNMLDRMDNLRSGILNSRKSKTDKYVLLSKGNILLDTERNCFIAATTLSESILNEGNCVFLGENQSAHYFAISVSSELAEQYEAVPLRAFINEHTLSDDKYAVLGEANSLLNWHHSHRFCSRCGSESVIAYGGWRRDCPSCEALHFPRTDPVVIMLVTRGEQCLLGRSYNFAEKHYSCLAGFIEPGETFEQAALRELWEEAGVKGGKVTYMLNQPWPFPSNLMLGVHVEAKTTELTIDYNELEDAMWVDKSEVKAVLNGVEDKRFTLPARIAIARNLLESWIKEA